MFRRSMEVDSERALPLLRLGLMLMLTAEGPSSGTCPAKHDHTSDKIMRLNASIQEQSRLSYHKPLELFHMHRYLC